MVLRHSLISAIVLFLVGVVWMALEKLLGSSNQPFFLNFLISNLVIIPTIWIYAWGSKRYRQKFPQKKITFLQSFGFGAMTTLMVMATYPIQLWIFEHIINPQYYDILIEKSVKSADYLQMVAKELKVSPNQINNKQLIEYAHNNINHDSQLYSGILGSATMGTLISLTIGLFSSKKTN